MADKLLRSFRLSQMNDPAIVATFASLEKANTTSARSAASSLKSKHSMKFQKNAGADLENGPPVPPSSPKPTAGSPHNILNKECWWWTTHIQIIAYQVLFAAIVSANMSVLLVLESKRMLRPDSIMDVVAGNLFVSIFVRNEYFINFHLTLFTAVPISTPLFIRKLLADCHHFGGVHSGCALSAVIWYVAYIAHTTSDFVQSGNKSALIWVDIVACYSFLVILLLISITALPHARRAYHNAFENTHRFGGWMALAILWIHVVVSAIYTADSTSFLKHPGVYFLLLTTLLVLHPWLRLRRVQIHPQQLSRREIMLTFEYKDMPYLSTMRFSSSGSPFGSEWHAFATIPSHTKQTASIVIAEAGDWTRNIINNPPTELWIRNPSARNFLVGVRMFRRVLIVATGAGIGPCLSCLSSLSDEQRKDKVVKVLWSAIRPFDGGWEFALDTIRGVDPKPMICDSRDGRLDLVFDAHRMAEEYLVDAVFVVSKMDLTDRIVRYLRLRGVAAYGAVFDS